MFQPVSTFPKGICGAFGPVAGLQDLAAKLPPDADQAAELLRQLRAGQFDAGSVSISEGRRTTIYYPTVVAAFMPLLARAIRVPAFGQACARGWHDDRLGFLFLRLVQAVHRLRCNDKLDAVKEIERELYRGRLGYLREISEDIRPPASTNSDRKKRGLPPLPTLKRVREIERNGRFVDPLEDDETLAEAGLITQPAEIHETEELVAETPLERSIIGLLKAGFSEREIAASLRTTRHQVRRIIAILRLRAQRAA